MNKNKYYIIAALLAAVGAGRGEDDTLTLDPYRWDSGLAH